jgi:transcription elongation factor/antiterminator RfaH
MEEWFTLHTKPKAEYQVATALQRRGLEIYLPVIEVPKGSRGRQSAPFFPCYLFLKIDFELLSLSLVQGTPGLRRVLTSGDWPVPVSNDIIELIQRKLGAIKANSGPPAHVFEPGDMVRITDGPFRDMLAIFEGPTTPRERVQVLLAILGRTSRVQVALTDLEMVHHRIEASTPRLRRTRGQGRRIKGISQQAS